MDILNYMLDFSVKMILWVLLTCILTGTEVSLEILLEHIFWRYPRSNQHTPRSRRIFNCTVFAHFLLAFKIQLHIVVKQSQ